MVRAGGARLPRPQQRRGRRYAYLVLESPVRPALEDGLAGWVFRPLDAPAHAARRRPAVGEHDFTSFRSSELPRRVAGEDPARARHPRAAAPTGASTSTPSAFLHHMVRNVHGLPAGSGQG
jgi:tRNA pseudouridine38-40 synthase